MGSDCGLTDVNCDTVGYIKRGVFGLTLTVDAITLITIIIFRKYQSFSQRIFLNILLSNIGESISNLSNDGEHNILCSIAGYFCQAFGFTLFMWVCGLTVFLFTLLHVKPEKRPRERTYMVICWLVPFAVAAVPIVTQDYGPAGVFCWITDHKTTGEIWRFIVWWGPVLAGILAIFGTFVYMYCKSAQNKNAASEEGIQHNKLVKKYLKPLTGYAATFAVLHILMFIDRVYTIRHQPVLVLRILHMGAFGLYGTILCSLFYLMSGKKDFTSEKFRAGLKYYKRLLTCRPIGRVTTIILDTTLPTATDHTMRRQISFNHNCLEQGLPEEEFQPSKCVGCNKPQSAVAIQVFNYYQADQVPNEPITPVQEEVMVKPTLRYLTARQRSVDILSSDEQLSLNELQDVRTPISEQFPKSFADVTEAEHQSQCSTGSAVDPETRYSTHGVTINVSAYSTVQPTEQGSCDRSQSDDITLQDPPDSMDLSIGPDIAQLGPDVALPDTSERTDSVCDYTYDMKAGSDLVKLYIAEEDAMRYETWSDEETVSTFISRVKEELPENSTVIVEDKDGAYFGKNVTWKQIKSQGVIKILINNAVTTIRIMDDTP